MAPILGLVWAVLAASPFVVRARALGGAARVAELRPIGRAKARRTRTRSVPAPVRRIVGVAAGAATVLSVRRARRAADADLARELPVVVDLVGVAVSAGCTPYLAVEMVSQWGPPRAAAAFGGVLETVRLGQSFEQAQHELARGSVRFRPLVDALLVADRTGAPVGARLARVADQERAALRRRAEAHARRVPVRLLFPLVFLVLPAFVLLTVVPGLVAGLDRL